MSSLTFEGSSKFAVEKETYLNQSNSLEMKSTPIGPPSSQSKEREKKKREGPKQLDNMGAFGCGKEGGGQVRVVRETKKDRQITR